MMVNKKEDTDLNPDLDQDPPIEKIKTKENTLEIDKMKKDLDKNQHTNQMINTTKDIEC